MTDIALAINTQPIKNGSSILTCYVTGMFSRLNTYISNKPDISSIATKYDNKFDQIHYYTGGGSIDGGIYTGNEVNGGTA